MEIKESQTDKKVYSVPEVAKTLGISRGLAYEMARSGQIPTIQLGKRYIVPAVQLELMLRGQWERNLARV